MIQSSGGRPLRLLCTADVAPVASSSRVRLPPLLPSPTLPPAPLARPRRRHASTSAAIQPAYTHLHHHPPEAAASPSPVPATSFYPRGLLDAPYISSSRRYRNIVAIHKRLSADKRRGADVEATLRWLAKPFNPEYKTTKVDEKELKHPLAAMRQTLHELIDLATQILHRPELRRYAAILAQHMILVSLLLRRKGGHRSEKNTHIPRAGSLAIKLLPFVESQHSTIKTRTLRVQAFALAGERKPALAALEGVLSEVGERLAVTLGPQQQLNIADAPLFTDVATALQAILELDLVLATAAQGLTPGASSQRAEILRLGRILTPYRRLGERGSRNDEEDAADRREAQSALHRLRDVLGRCNLVLPCTSHVFRDVMLAFDDNVALLTQPTLQKIVEDALARDRYAALRIVVALASSLMRMGRLDEAWTVVRMANKDRLALPPQVVETLIRSASIAGSYHIADAAVGLVFKNAGREDEQQHRVERSTWIVIAGYIARKGDEALLKEVWRRIIAEYPDEAGSNLLKDHFLVVYARGEGTMPLMRKHLADHWILPGEDHAHAGRKRRFTEHTFETVIPGFAQGGNLALAEEYLNHMEAAGFRNAVTTYNALLSAFVRRSDVPKAQRFWARYDERGVARNAATYEIMAGLFAFRGDVESAFALLDVVEQSGTRPSQRILGTMIWALTRAAEFKRATQLFHSMLRSSAKGQGGGPGVVAWNAMLRILVTKAAPFERVVELLDNMAKEGVEPDDKTFALAMQSASEAGDLAAAEHLFARADGAEATPTMAQPEPEPAEEEEEAEVDDDGWLRDDNDAQRDFDSAVAASTSAQRSTSSTSEDDPLASLKQRRANRYHFTILIHALLGAGNVSAAKEYFDEMQRRGLRIDSLSWSVLARAYTKSESEGNQRLARDIIMRRMDEAERATHDEEDPNVRLSPAEPRGKSAEILVTPLLVRAANVGDLAQVEGIIGELEADGIELSISTMNILLDAYRRTQEIGSMLAAWERVFKRATANTGLAAQLRVEQQVVDAPGDRGKNNAKARTLVAPPRGSGRSGRQSRPSDDEGVLQNVDVPQVQRNALCVSLSIVLDGLLSAGMHEAIASIWSRARAAGFAFDPSNWNDLAVALCRAHRVKDALRVVEKVLNEVPIGADGRNALLQLREKRQQEEAERRRLEEEARMRQTSASRVQQDSADERPATTSTPSSSASAPGTAMASPPSLSRPQRKDARSDDQVLPPTSSQQRRAKIERRDRAAAAAAQRGEAVAEEDVEANAAEADEEQDGDSDEAAAAATPEGEQQATSANDASEAPASWRLPTPSSTPSPLDVEPDDRFRLMARNAASRRGGGVSASSFLAQQNARRDRDRRRPIDFSDITSNATAKAGPDSDRARQHPILEALARQRRYDEMQAVWVAEWRTVDEVKEALQRYAVEVKRERAEDVTGRQAQAAASKQALDESGIIDALLSEYPVAKDALELQWEKQKAQEARQRVMEERIRLDEASRMT